MLHTDTCRIRRLVPEHDRVVARLAEVEDKFERFIKDVRPADPNEVRVRAALVETVGWVDAVIGNGYSGFHVNDFISYEARKMAESCGMTLVEARAVLRPPTTFSKVPP